MARYPVRNNQCNSWVRAFSDDQRIMLGMTRFSRSGVDLIVRGVYQEMAAEYRPYGGDNVAYDERRRWFAMNEERIRGLTIGAARAALTAGRDIGLMALGGEDWEYPIWLVDWYAANRVYLQQRADEQRRREEQVRADEQRRLDDIEHRRGDRSSRATRFSPPLFGHSTTVGGTGPRGHSGGRGGGHSGHVEDDPEPCHCHCHRRRLRYSGALIQQTVVLGGCCPCAM